MYTIILYNMINIRNLLFSPVLQLLYLSSGNLCLSIISSLYFNKYTRTRILYIILYIQGVSVFGQHQ